MTDDRQPNTTDFRKRRASPVYVETFGGDNEQKADNYASDYSEHVANAGGEVTDIRPYAVAYPGDYGADVYHFRVVTYRAQCRIARPAKPAYAYSGVDE